MTRQSRLQRIAERAKRRDAKAVRVARRKKKVVAPAPLELMLPMVPVPAPPSPKPASADPTWFCDPTGRNVHIEGLYRGASLFLILSGPSAAKMPLEALATRGVMTMGVNNSPAIHPCRLWTYVDSPCKFHQGIWRDPACMKFIPFNHYKPSKGIVKEKIGEAFTQVRRPDGKLAHALDYPGVLGYRRNANFRPDQWLTEPTVNWGNDKQHAAVNGHHHILNVMFVALKIAYVLGFKTVYLVGADFKMTDAQPYAFDEEKELAGCGSNNSSYSKLRDMFRILRSRWDAAGFNVVNVTPGSALDSVPAMRFSDAVQAATATMPAEPWDTRRWYDLTNHLEPLP